MVNRFGMSFRRPKLIPGNDGHEATVASGIFLKL